MNATIRDFTKIDWMGWAGAERFENDGEPMIAENDFILVVAGRGMLEVYLPDEDGIWGLPNTLTKPLAKALMAAVLDEVRTEADLRENGFTRLNG